jgi:pimeloyl-ACP methyl ester carboxylesterase
MLNHAVLLFVLAALLCAGLAFAQPARAAEGNAAGQQPFPGKKSVYHGCERYDFTVAQRAVLVVAPKQPAPGKPWVWRAEFFDAFPAFGLAMLEKGYHLVYMDVQNMYGAPVAMAHMDAFYAHLTSKRGLAEKVVLEGFSRGGLFAFNWAARNPGRVACLYLDAPVCDFKSWPGGKGRGKGSPGDWERLKKVYGLTEDEAIRYPLNPVDNLRPLAAAKIPLLHVCGETDTAVPMTKHRKTWPLSHAPTFRARFCVTRRTRSRSPGATKSSRLRCSVSASTSR